MSSLMKKIQIDKGITIWRQMDAAPKWNRFNPSRLENIENIMWKIVWAYKHAVLASTSLCIRMKSKWNVLYMKWWRRRKKGKEKTRWLKGDEVIKISEKVVCLLFNACQSIVRILVCCFCRVADVCIALSYSWISLLYNVKMAFLFYWLSYYSRTLEFVNLQWFSQVMQTLSRISKPTNWQI